MATDETRTDTDGDVKRINALLRELDEVMTNGVTRSENSHIRICREVIAIWRRQTREQRMAGMPHSVLDGLSAGAISHMVIAQCHGVLLTDQAVRFGSGQGQGGGRQA